MILENLHIRTFRSFNEEDVDFSSLTVFTGANDVGKSSLLRLLELMMSDSTRLQEHDVNQEQIGQSNWKADRRIGAVGSFRAQPSSKLVKSGRLQSGDLVKIDFELAPDVFVRRLIEVERKNNRTGHNENAGNFNRVIVIRPTDEIRDAIELTKPNPLESTILTVAFGKDFRYDHIRELTPARYTHFLLKGQQSLNAALARVLSPSIRLECSLSPIEGRRELLGIYLEDRHSAVTTLNSRGAGVRRVISILSSILGDVGSNSEFTTLLLDEPENALHADSQHILRGFLEQLAESGSYQVIYATHSASMINSFRPDSVRLVFRDVFAERAVSKVSAKVAAENWSSVRTSLGISPADSLLFAPISIIIEGETEAVAIPALLKKLYDAKPVEFADVPSLFSLTHLIDGMGDNFEHWVRLAKAQGALPIIFVDGDKIRRVNQTDVKVRHADVPVIALQAQTEFEQLVSQSDYFAAISNIHSKKDGPTLEQEFNSWRATSGVKPQVMFSKVVDSWLTDAYPDVVFSKPAVMRKALELAEIQNVRTVEIVQLVETVRLLAKKLK